MPSETESNDDELQEEDEFKSLYEYDTYEEFLEEEMLQDELIVGSTEKTWGDVFVKIGVYFIVGLLLLSILVLIGYVVAEVLIYLAEYADKNIDVNNTTTISTVLLFYSTEYL